MRYIFFFLALFMLMSPAMAQDKKVTIDIFADRDAAVPGETVTLALRQNIIDGWHTYWVNPGDSGEAMSVDWDLPAGISVPALTFPTPDKTVYGPDLVSYTMHGAPIIMASFDIPNGFSADSVTIAGKAYWLVCDEICIPESQDIRITLPVADAAESVNEAIFYAARDAMPQDMAWFAEVTQDKTQTILTVSVPKDVTHQMTDIMLIPYDHDIVRNGATAMADIGDNGLIRITQDKGFADLGLKDSILPVIIKTDYAAYVVQAENILATGGNVAMGDLAVILLFAFIGGMILNLMPCVFPVLSMKALSLVKLSTYERRHAQRSGFAYAAGIILSFLAVAGLLILFKNAGEAIGWGFQLQNPIVIAVLMVIVIGVGLNLLGVFEIAHGRFLSFGDHLTRGNDVRASFFAGVLAMVVATPCTAPFMATAVGFAVTQDAATALTVFAVLGLGLAFPYLIFCFVPAAQRLLPKPGAWMETFRKILAIPMFLTAIWLGWVLVQQIGFADMPSDKQAHEDFSKARLEQVLEAYPDQPVFVNMTAAWCITCLVNEQTSLSAGSVKQAFTDANVIYIKGDWTNRNAEIADYLETFDRSGVPLYVFYGVQDDTGKRPDPVILPQILTPDTVINSVKGDAL